MKRLKAWTPFSRNVRQDWSYEDTFQTSLRLFTFPVFNIAVDVGYGYVIFELLSFGIRFDW